MKNKKILYFVGLVTVILVITGLNIYFGHRGDIAADKSKLVAENKEQKEELTKLNKQLEEAQPSSQEQERREIINVANKFIQTAYVQKEEGYEDRRKEAKTLMTNDLFERYYPSKNFYQKNVETEIEQPSLYLQTKYPEEKHATLIANFEHQLHEKQNNTTQKTKIYIEIFLEKKGNQWVVTDLTDIYSVEE
ncbi:hypothetical protein NSQ76_20210 [Bacillus sp. FSL M8-0256]|uniref:hypothetical protein n=1 Tax=Bacillus TaxID=1386 RepID=UPI0013B8F6D7|nr:hypothetical protein [Bacillus subtilis]KAF2427332.1 hypothetical protein B6K89_03880 [Bacillus subtilis]MEC0312069.1 hypothetical protein [Bacillus subtilis]MEC0363623.1 hypothetical protein [Bacillus subtilis]